MTRALPFKPGDWVSNAADEVARVRSVYEDRGEVLLDLVLYARDGRKIGRASPAEGGPRSFEPACSSSGWERIAKPLFPVALRWITVDGVLTARYWAGDRLPPAQWRPRRRKFPAGPSPRPIPRNAYRAALQLIANGHNDPRRVAREALKTQIAPPAAGTVSGARSTS